MNTSLLIKPFQTKKEYKSRLIDFNNTQEQILLGSLLGDGSISKKKNQQFCYREMHSLKQEDYLYWKNKNLNFNLYKRNSKSLGKIRVEIRKENKSLKKYYNQFYLYGKKIVTKEALDNLNEIGLTFWYLDDGHYAYRTKCIVLSTQAFDLEGNKLIQKYFRERWNINWEIQVKYDKRYNIKRYNL